MEILQVDPGLIEKTVLCAPLKTYDPTVLRFPNKVQYGPMG